MAGDGTAVAPTAPTAANFDAIVGTDTSGTPETVDDGGEGKLAAGMFGEQHAEAVDPNAPSEPDADAAAELIHGMSQAEVLKAIKDGSVPKELWDKLRVPLMVNGEEVPATLAEYREGAMRLADYSRSKQALARDRKDFEGAQGAFVAMVEAWRNDPAAARRDMEMLGIPLEQLAMSIAQEYVAYQQMTPQERELAKQNRELMRQREAMQYQYETLQHGAGTSRQEQVKRELGERINRMRPIAFQASGIPESPTARTMFMNHLGALWDTGVELTQAVVNQAAQATAQELSDMARRHLKDTPKRSKTPAELQVKMQKLQAKLTNLRPDKEHKRDKYLRKLAKLERKLGKSKNVVPMAPTSRALPPRAAASAGAGADSPKRGSVTDFEGYLRSIGSRA